MIKTLLISFSVLFLFFNSVFAQVVQQDFDALVAIYNHMDGENWDNTTGWNIDVNNVSNDWHGITVENNRITGISLTSNGLKYTIPPELGLLSELKSLNLAWNEISGEIPAEIGMLTELESLILRHNLISGSVPLTLLNLYHLQTFIIEYCYISELPDLTSLNSLNDLDVSTNCLTFKDLVPNMTLLESYYDYCFQREIDTDPNYYEISTGDDIFMTLNLSFTSNNYQWYKDNEAITDVSATPDLILTDLNQEDAGFYQCKVTNTIFQNFSIYSEKIVVHFNEDPNVIVTCGNISDNTVWDADTVKVVCDLTISDDVVLTIKPGTYVDFLNYSKLIINGSLIAEGSENDSIIFHGCNGFIFDNGAAGMNGAMNDNILSTFYYCSFNNSSGSCTISDGGGVFKLNNFSGLHISNSVIKNSFLAGGSDLALGGLFWCIDSDPVIEKTDILNTAMNQAYMGGNFGAVFYGINSSAVFRNCKISYNDFHIVCPPGMICGSLSGVGFYCEDNSDVKIINTLISNNEFGGSSGISGAAVVCLNSSPLIVNSNFSDNLYYAGGLKCISASSPQLYNTVIWNGIVDCYTSGYDFYNSVYIDDDESEPEFYHCNIEGGREHFNGSGASSYGFDYETHSNINLNPLFILPEENNYAVQSNSPCINAGISDTSGLHLLTLDLEGNPRILEDTIDIGVNERLSIAEDIYQGHISGNTIWDADTVKVTGNIIIDDDVILHISAGTVVEFQDFYNINVKGTLSALGTRDQKILFTVKDTTGFSDTFIEEGAWGGIIFNGMHNGYCLSDNDSSRFEFCIFEYGKAIGEDYFKRNGGIFKILSYSKVIISNCTFLNNLSNYYGGAVYSDSRLVLENNEFSNNKANFGGAAYLEYPDIIFNNNLLYGNTAESTGGGAFLYSYGNCNVSNNTIINNKSDYGSGIGSYGTNMSFYNNIFWGNQSTDTSQLYCMSGEFYNNLIQNGRDGLNIIDTVNLIYENNSEENPAFIDLINNNFRLSSFSPGIDTGFPDTTGLYLPIFDLDGNERIMGPSIEIGAYEYNASYAGPDQEICTDSTFMQADDPFPYTGEWSVSESTGVPFLESPTLYNTKVKYLGRGINIFTWTVEIDGELYVDDVTITNNSVYTNTSQDIATCADYAWIYATELEPGETGLWTLISGSGTIHDPTNNESYVSELGFGDNLFRWTVTNGICSAYSDISVFCTLPDSMYLPNAGPDQVICEDHTILEAGELLPGWEGYWTIVGGAGYIADPTNRITEVSGLNPGDNVFCWTIYWPEYGCHYSDYIILTNKSLNVNLTDSIFVCSNESYLHAPEPGPGEFGIWTVISGSGVIADPTKYLTEVSNLNTGENKFRWTLTNNHCSEYDNLIIFNNLHIASATALDTIVTADTAVLMGNFPLPDWSGHWEIITGGGTIADPNSPYTTVYNINTGENIFRWSISREGCVNYDEVTVNYDPVNVDLLPDFDIMIYPNPTDGFITVSSSVDLSDAIFELFSISGQQVNFKLIFISANAYETNLLNLAKGIYFLKIRLKDQIKLVKIVKK